MKQFKSTDHLNLWNWCVPMNSEGWSPDTNWEQYNKSINEKKKCFFIFVSLIFWFQSIRYQYSLWIGTHSPYSNTKHENITVWFLLNTYIICFPLVLFRNIYPDLTHFSSFFQPIPVISQNGNHLHWHSKIHLRSSSSGKLFSNGKETKINVSFLQPIGVWMEKGCGADLIINIVLTILGFIPGVIHACFIICWY